MRDRVKASINHSKMESTSNNGEVKWKIIQVRMNTKRKQIDVKSERKKKRQNIRDECLENSVENNETIITNYGLDLRINK